MIIQLRGTSGSGKTTAMRKVKDALGKWTPHFTDGRRRPLYYTLAGVGTKVVYLLGHYEIACGGCDTLGSARAVYDLLDDLKSTNPSALFLAEGLLLSEDVKWTSCYPAATRVVFLSTPLEKCLAQIAARRAADGNDKPLDPRNTTNRVRTIERARGKLGAAGVYCRILAPDQAPGVILRWVREHLEK